MKRFAILLALVLGVGVSTSVVATGKRLDPPVRYGVKQPNPRVNYSMGRASKRPNPRGYLRAVRY